ncbi:hypothetical protein [Sphingomonas kyeonggiensis]|uniref:Uncharacterized protein n=1 Tax=Sphingomonas kyeonggiensis TaxID=1268553 RepID=A0A7W6NUQ6_9SPHN|nr:hypothetical protein [Sphingomonas kyeonggiensis]MBB4097309.1 hypothetical protein [Sphingomonas kyeonggiensis]
METALRFSGPWKSSFEPALEGQAQFAKGKLHGREWRGLFGPQQRHGKCECGAARGKHRRLSHLRGLDHRDTLDLPDSTAIGLTDTGQAREEGSQEKQQFQTASL